MKKRLNSGDSSSYKIDPRETNIKDSFAAIRKNDEATINFYLKGGVIKPEELEELRRLSQIPYVSQLEIAILRKDKISIQYFRDVYGRDAQILYILLKG